jgi:hypothetical protein
MTLEILHLALVLLRRGAGGEGAEVATLARPGSGLREYSRYSPDLSLRIMAASRIGAERLQQASAHRA